MDRLSKLVPSRRRLVTTAIGILVVALVGAWVLDDLVGGPEVRRGTRVVGTEIGGLNRDAAIDTLAPLAEAIGSTPVELQLHDRSIESTIAELGMQLDVEATVASASGHPSVVVRPAAWIADFIGSRDVDPVLAVDIDALERALQDLGADPETPQIELVDGSLQPVIGAVIPVPDLELLADVLVVSATSKPSEPITIVVPTRGTATPDPTAAAELATQANELTAGGVRVRLQGTDPTFTIEEHALRAFVMVRGSAEDPRLTFDDDSVNATLASLFAGIGSEGEPATISVDDEGVVEIIGGEPGYECCGDGGAPALLAGLEAGDSVVELPGAAIPHPEGREWVESLGLTDVVGEFTTNFKAGESRVLNIARIAELTQGVLILPGEQFSVNDFVGRRTREKGFVSAGVIYSGVFQSDIGGGISQYATTLFNAAFFAGLDFIDYQSHTIYIDRYPYGREATLSYPRPDLVIENNTPNTVMLWPATTETSVTVRLYSTPWVMGEQTDQSRRGEGSSCTRVTTERTRTWLEDGRTETDTVTARYRPEGLNCDGTPSVTTTTTTTTTTEPPPTSSTPSSTTSTTTTSSTTTIPEPPTTTTTTI